MYNTGFDPKALMQQCLADMMSGRGKGVGANEYAEDFNLFFTDVENGRVPCPPAFVRVISRLVSAALEEHAAHGGDDAHGCDADMVKRHAEFKCVLEKLREAPQGERMELLNRHFRDLSPSERMVLLQLADDRSLKHKAAATSMSVEEFVRERRGAESKLIV